MSKQVSQNVSQPCSSKDPVKDPKKVPEICNICADKTTKIVRKLISCPHCQKQACVVCIKAYALSMNSKIHCMYCKIEWTREFTNEILTKSFIENDYKTHRKDILLEIEKSKIPHTMEYITATNEIQDYRQYKETWSKFNSEFERDLRIEYGKMASNVDHILRYIREDQKNKDKFERYQVYYRNACNEVNRIKTETRYLELKNKLSVEYTIYISNLRTFLTSDNQQKPVFNDIYQLSEKGDLVTITGQSKKQEQEPKYVYTVNCPENDCKGFLDKNYKCEICKKKFCSQCHELKVQDQEHVCNEDIKASIKTLKKDSKPCPKCSCMIHKIAGCDQMWCTQCKTSFSWRTGKLCTSVVHNPHYFDWIARTGGDLNTEIENPCGFRDNYFVTYINRFIRQYSGDRRKHFQHTFRICQHLLHIIQVEVPKIKLKKGSDVDIHRSDRILYINGSLSESLFKNRIYQNEKKHEELEDVRAIIATFVQVLDEAAREAFNSQDNNIECAKHQDAFYEMYERILEYTNESLKNLCEKYKTKRYYYIKDLNQGAKQSKHGGPTDYSRVFINLHVPSNKKQKMDSDK